jgi:hypothetical protein
MRFTVSSAVTSYFVYSNIPGSGRGWTLAVLAAGRRDADTYMRTHHRGGKFSYKSDSPKADCGAVTSAATELIKAKNEKEEAH